MDWPERIIIDPSILAGKPVVKDTRLSVEFILGLLAGGWTEEQVLANYPALTSEDIRACLAYAAEDRAHDALRRSEDAVDETLSASFPASDPPNWTLGPS